MANRLPNAADYALLTLLAAIWGSSFAFVKIGVSEVPPVTLTASRLVIAGTLLAAFVIFSGRQFPQGRRVWRFLVAAAVFGNVLPFCLIAWGQQAVPSNTAAILMGVMPLITMVLAHAFTDDEKVNARKAFGMLMGLVGLCVLVGPAALGGLTTNFVSQLAILAAATCYAVNAVVTRRMRADDLVAAVAVVMLISAATTSIAALVIEQPLAVDAGTGAWSAVIALGVLHTAIATLIMFVIIGRAGASFFGQLNLLVPMFGVVWGALILAEVPGWNALAALCLIVLGILVARGGLGTGTPARLVQKGQLEK